MDALGFPIANLTPAALLLVAVYFVFSGRLVPRRTYDDMVQERDDWKAAHTISETVRREQAKQIGELLVQARATDALIRSLPRPKGER